MAMTVRDIMITQPMTLPKTSSVLDAARAMRDSHIGDVMVQDDGQLYGILTDRDIVVRVVAEGRDFSNTTIEDICSHDLTTIQTTDSVDRAIELMRQHAIRRLPVVENGQTIGIVSLGDLALERDPQSALGEISAAAPNQ